MGSTLSLLFLRTQLFAPGGPVPPFPSPHFPELHACPASLNPEGPFTEECSSSQPIPVNWGDRLGVARGREVERVESF